MNYELQKQGCYIIPFCTEKSEQLIQHLLRKDFKQNNDKIDIRNLTNYISDIIHGNSQLCRVYSMQNISQVGLEFPKWCKDNNRNPILIGCDVFLFKTGIGFLNFIINYNDMSLEELTNFSYAFKRIGQSKIKKETFGNFYDVSQTILGNGLVRPFFYLSDETKHECIVYQNIGLESKPSDFNACMFRLRRAYSSNFIYDDSVSDSNYDMDYIPYSYIHWGASQNGFACVYVLTGNDMTDDFLNKYHYKSLCNDYYFMFILLLCQRYTLLNYVTKMLKCKNNEKALAELKQNLIEFKLEMSFKVISNEMVYQNIYSNVMRILGIDLLVEDTQDMNERLLQLEHEAGEKQVKKTGIALNIISVLVIASFLIDASDYLDRFGIPNFISTIISAGVGVLVLFLILFFIFRKK